MHSAPRRLSDLFLPIVVLASIGLVLALTDWRGRSDMVERLEHRQTAPLPSAPRSLSALYHYPAELSHFLDDHYGMRATAVDLRARLWFWLLGDSVSPDVIVGRDHWLFLTADRELADMLRTDPLSESALRAWKDGIEARRSWLAARGIRYLFVISPDKRSLYPEQLPHLYPRPGPSRREQLDAQMAGQDAFIDLTAAMRVHKSEGLIYYRWDTHWDWRGAYDAYVAAVERLGLTPEPMALGSPLGRELHTGDLGRMLGLQLAEPDRGPLPSCPRPDSPPDPGLFDNAFNEPGKVYQVPATDCASGKGRLLMFQDSFGGRWAPWLSTEFARAVYVWRQPSFAELKRMVEIEHPTVVIEERLERFLFRPLRP